MHQSKERGPAALAGIETPLWCVEVGEWTCRESADRLGPGDKVLG